LWLENHLNVDGPLNLTCFNPSLQLTSINTSTSNEVCIVKNPLIQLSIKMISVKVTFKGSSVYDGSDGEATLQPAD